MIAAGEAGHVAGFADHRGRDDGARAEDLRECGAAGPDGDSELLLGVTHCVSTARRSARNSAASSQRAASTAPDGLSCSSR